MKKSFLIGLVGIFVLTGCFTVDSLRTTQTVDRVCLQSSPARAHAKVLKILTDYAIDQEKMLYDYRKKYNILKRPWVGKENYVEDKKIGRDRYEMALVVENPMLGKVYGFMVETSRGSGKCRSLVQIKYMNKYWKRGKAKLAQKIRALR